MAESWRQKKHYLSGTFITAVGWEGTKKQNNIIFKESFRTSFFKCTLFLYMHYTAVTLCLTTLLMNITMRRMVFVMFLINLPNTLLRLYIIHILAFVFYQNLSQKQIDRYKVDPLKKPKNYSILA